MKLKQHFTKQKAQAELNNEDFNKFIDALPDDLEIPDIAVNLLEENFLTRKRALSDKQVYDKIRAESLNAVDEQVKTILPMLTGTDRETIEKEPNSYKKLELVKTAFDNAIKAAKIDNPDAGDQVKELKKTQSELTEKIKSINLDHETSVKTLKESFEKDKKGMKLDWTLDKKLGEFEFGDEYKTVRPALTDSIISKIKSDHVLELDDKGNIQVLDRDTGKPKFDGNNPVTLDHLLVEPLKPFIKKNNKDEGGQGGQQQQRRPAGQQQQSQQKPLNEMTLAERRQAGVRINQ
jgi:hypothetical protein